MKKPVAISWIVATLTLGLTACATTPAPSVAGRWKPVNRYTETPQEIPLQQSYVFFVSPLDGTLKNTLTRWARDSKMTISYLHSSDFTLHAQVANIRTDNLREALNQLSAAYAPQHVQIVVEQNQIVARFAEGATTEAGASAPSP